LVYIAYFLEAGLLLVVLPWSSFWGRNFFVEHWPALRPFIVNDFVRGAVSGLGVVNLVAGVADLVPVFLTRDPHDASLNRSPGREGRL
jgi:hypothetical protein